MLSTSFIELDVKKDQLKKEELVTPNNRKSKHKVYIFYVNFCFLDYGIQLLQLSKF